jgi:hypothetical protein
MTSIYIIDLEEKHDRKASLRKIFNLSRWFVGRRFIFDYHTTRWEGDVVGPNRRPAACLDLRRGHSE